MLHTSNVRLHLGKEQVGKWENEHVFAQFVFQSQINEENSWTIMAAGTFPTVTG